MSNNMETLIQKAVENMIKHTAKNDKLKKLSDKHDKKLHFIPKRYRIFGGMLQSMNIQFGNFIEELMTLLINNNPNYEIIGEFSGKKNNSFIISVSNEKIIDEYITKCQTDEINDFTLNLEFIKLLNEVINNNDNHHIKFKHDIDVLFRDKLNDIYYYIEIKYNDDHDTGKFVDINRKFIKTSAYLINKLDIKDLEKFKPIIFYFNNKKMKGNIYVPEETNIYRGKKFFDEFLNINYEDVEKFLFELSENKETIETFNNLYNQVMNIE